MAKVKDLNRLKAELTIGEIKGSELWRIDGQEKLKGNPLKAFERDLECICKFSKCKKGRNNYYNIEEIYAVNKEKYHANKTSLKGIKNREGKIGFKSNSNIEFVASVILNKIEYFELKEGNNFKSISALAKACGLYSENRRARNRINQIIERALDRLYKLGLINLQKGFNKVVDGEHIAIDKEEYLEYKEKSKQVFREVLGDMIADYYKSFFRFKECFNWQNKNELIEDYWRAMNTDIEYVYRVYKVECFALENKIENKVYINLINVLLWDDETPVMNRIRVQDRIKKFVREIEKNTNRRNNVSIDLVKTNVVE